MRSRFVVSYCAVYTGLNIHNFGKALTKASLPCRGHLVTEPTSAPSNRTQKLKPDVDISVRPPRRGVNTASGVRGLGVEEVIVLEERAIGVATRTRGAGGG